VEQTKGGNQCRAARRNWLSRSHLGFERPRWWRGKQNCPGGGQEERHDGADLLHWKKKLGVLRIDQAKRL